MTTTPSEPTTALPGRPPVVDRATWQAARDELLVREKAHTREGDALAPAAGCRWWRSTGRSRVGTDGGRSWTCSRVATSSWSTTPCGTTAPHQGQCEGCTFNLWHMRDAVYLNAAASRSPS